MMSTKTLSLLLLINIILFFITSKCQPDGGDNMEGGGENGGENNEMGGGGDTEIGDMEVAVPDISCDVNGADAEYTEVIDGDLRRITSNGCPNHYCPCTGKDEFCVEGETEAAPGTKNINIPAYPCFNNYNYSDYNDTFDIDWNGYPVYCLLSDLGIMLNGVSIFSPTADTTCQDAVGLESGTFDTCGGHAGPGGHYHYHAAPACLLEQVGDRVEINPDGHSPQIGWAHDGFPVYGPHGLNGEYILLCTQNYSNLTDCLDNCSGHRQHTIDGFKYHYHIAAPVGDLETSPLYPTPTPDRWPYTFGCYRGIPSDWSQVLSEEPYPDLECVESGVTDDYVPIAMDGLADVFWYPAQDDATITTNTPATTDGLTIDDTISSTEELGNNNNDNAVGELFIGYALVVIFIFGMIMI